MRTRQSKNICLLVLFLLAAAAPVSVVAQVNYPPYGPTVAPVPNTDSAAPQMPVAKERDQQSNWNMELAGHSDLQGRHAYQPIIISQDKRQIAYVGHHAAALTMNPLTGRMEPNGTSIVDVTDPANTRYLAHIPGPAEGDPDGVGGAQMVRVCGGNMLSRAVKGKWYLLRAHGNSAHQIYDVTDPSKPTLLTTVVENLAGTHKSWWECDTGIAYLVARAESDGWAGGNHLKIYDLSDPAKPVYIRDYGILGAQPGATAFIGLKPGLGIHGPISAGPERNRVYVAGGGVLLILDRKKLLTEFKNPVKPTEEEMRAPIIGYTVMSPDQGAHTAMPLFDVPIPGNQGHPGLKTRDLVLLTSEQGRETHCGVSPRPNDSLTPHMAFLVDVTSEATPWNLATFNVDQRMGDYCGKGGRFGAHASTESFYPPYYGKLAIFSWFNAGTRVFDIRNPFDVKEIAYFIPAPNKTTGWFCADGVSHPEGDPKITKDCDRVIQTNNVEIDDRGLIYSADRAGSGLHIMRLTGPAAAVAARPPS